MSESHGTVSCLAVSQTCVNGCCSAENKAPMPRTLRGSLKEHWKPSAAMTVDGRCRARTQKCKAPEEITQVSTDMPNA